MQKGIKYNESNTIVININEIMKEFNEKERMIFEGE